MSWKRPQRVIKNTLLGLSILSFIGAIFWLALLYIWKNHPTMVHDYDEKIPNYYTDQITRLQTRTHKGKSPEDTLKRYQQLAKALEGVTVLHKHYQVYSDNQANMIDFLVNADQVSKAKKLANNWQENYPYDFNAKFKYTDVLLITDIKQAIAYLELVYKKHKDIFELNQRYVKLLLDDGQFEKALSIANYSETQNRKERVPSFTYYYTDESNKKFRAETNIVIPKTNYQTLGEVSKVNMLIPQAGITSLRFDFDNLGIGSQIENLYFNIKTKGKTFKNIVACPLRHLNYKENTFTTTGVDPYVKLNLPEELIGLEEQLEIEAFAKITIKKKLVLNNILEHPSLTIQCLDSNNFESSQAKEVLLSPKLSGFYSHIKFEQQSCQFIKFNLPNIKNLSFSKLKLTINDSHLLTSENITQINSISRAKDDVFVVNNENPSIIYKLNEQLSASDIKVNLELGTKP